MNTERMVDMIKESLYMCDEDEETGEGVIEIIHTYREGGLLTNDEGIIVRLKDQKSVFHITVTEQES